MRLSLQRAVFLSLCAAVSVVSTAEAASSKSFSSPAPETARAETENYVVEVKALPAKPGVQSTFAVYLTPKGSYHTNAQYPYRFKTGVAPEGITYPKADMLRADGSFEEKRGTFQVPFVASRSGKYTVGGTFFLSVCSDANCIMDKVALDTVVEVK